VCKFLKQFTLLKAFKKNPVFKTPNFGKARRIKSMKAARPEAMIKSMFTNIHLKGSPW
jgi:hypothetical protein